MAKRGAVTPKSLVTTDPMQLVGSWAFIVGVIIAIVAGFWPLTATVVSVLIALGLIVGILNVTATETTRFLLAAVALVIVSAFGGNNLSLIQGIGPYIDSIVKAMITFIMPATIIVALKAIYLVAREA